MWNSESWNQLIYLKLLNSPVKYNIYSTKTENEVSRFLNQGMQVLLCWEYLLNEFFFSRKSSKLWYVEENLFPPININLCQFWKKRIHIPKKPSNLFPVCSVDPSLNTDINSKHKSLKQQFDYRLLTCNRLLKTSSNFNRICLRLDSICLLSIYCCLNGTIWSSGMGLEDRSGVKSNSVERNCQIK